MSAEIAVTDHGMADVLARAECSLLVSTYSSNRLMVLSVAEDANLRVHLCAMERPMGISVTDHGIAVGTKEGVTRFFRTPGPEAEARYLPQDSFYTGAIHVHDVSEGSDRLWFVATKANCIASLDGVHSFVPEWFPPQIDQIVSEDRCHLNGMALRDGSPAYASALGTGNTEGSWREDFSGVVYDVRTNEVLAEGLLVPHSPRWYDGSLYLLESGYGRLLRLDTETKEVITVASVPGFTRGMSIHNGIAFVGTSRIRESSAFSALPVANDSPECSVWAIDLSTGQVLGVTRIEEGVHELFDVAVVPGVSQIEVGEPGSALAMTSWILPQAATGLLRPSRVVETST